MKKLPLVLFLMLVFVHLGRAQKASPSARLEYVDNHFPIKIDGGGSFYTYDTTDLDSMHYIFVISNRRIAFMKVSNKSDYIFLQPADKNRPGGDMDTSTFTGSGYVVKLNTRKTKEIDPDYDMYSGTLTIKHNNNSATIKVHGSVWVYNRY